MSICTVDNCGREARCKGLCAKHYIKQWRSGTLSYTSKAELKCQNPKCLTPPEEVKKITKGLCKNCYYRKWRKGNVDYEIKERKPCKIVGCNKLAVAKGLCDTHRKRVDRHGTADAGRPEWWGDFEAKRKRAQAAKFKANFGITLEDYNLMFERQGGVCKICNKPETRIDPRTCKVYALCVDHDKVTGKVRGLLCMSHNAGIGLFNHDISLLESAITYLKEYL